MFTTWMNILKAVPKSFLWLLESNSLAHSNLKRQAKKLGVNPRRLVFTKRLPKPQHLARHRLADCYLDTRIYNGHTTTSDALFVGVPVITLTGNHFASRVSTSLLKAIDLPQLITKSFPEYQKLAIDLASNPKKLNEIKSKLEVNRRTKPLFNTKLFTKNIEKSYQIIWKRHQQGKKPVHIYVK